MEEEKKGGKNRPKFVVSVQVQPTDKPNLRVALGFEKNGAMVLNFQDTSEMNQGNRYINEAAYPNSAIKTHGKYGMWLSMFTRHAENDELTLIGKEKKSKD